MIFFFNIIILSGLKYKGYKFRSKCIIEYGKPYEVEDSLIQKYKSNKREATAMLLDILQAVYIILICNKIYFLFYHKILKRLKDVTYTAPSYRDFMAIMLVRSIYKPSDIHLTTEKEILLNRRFLVGYEKLKDHPEVKKMMKNVREYQQKLKKLNIEDY